MPGRFILAVSVAFLLIAGAKAQDSKKKDSKDATASDLKKLEGNWKRVRSEYKGNFFPAGFRKEGLFFEENKLSWTEDQKAVGQTGDVTIDATTNPKSIDVEITSGQFIGKKLLGIYEIKGNKLTICWSEPGGEKRPKKFTTKVAVGAGTQLDAYDSVDANQAESSEKSTDSKKTNGKTSAAAIAKKLEGNWKMTRQEQHGNLTPPIVSQNWGLFFEDGKIVWTDNGQARGQTGNFTIDASASPMKIDVEITSGNVGRKILGIFELKGDKLTICWGETGSEKRPKKFVTKTAVGAGVQLETYQSVDANQSADDKHAEPKKNGEKVAAGTIAKKLEGNWKLTRQEYKGNLFPLLAIQSPGLFFEDGKILWTTNGQAVGQKGNFTIDTSTSPMTIDVEITSGNVGQKILGIFELKGDKLTICWGETGSEKRPKKFVTKTAVGAGVQLETYQSVDANHSADDKHAEPKKNGEKIAAGDIAKRLEGNWKLTRQEWSGRLMPEIVLREAGIFFEDGKIQWTNNPPRTSGQRGDFKIDTSTSPMSIDVEITRGRYIGKTVLGIFELKGDKLTISWGEPGSEKRPMKFVTKVAVGSGEHLDTYQSVDANKSVDDEKHAESKKKGEKIALGTIAKKLQGNWKLVRQEKYGQLWPERAFQNAGLFFEDGKISWMIGAGAVSRRGDFTINTDVSPMTIDFKPSRGNIGPKLLGIFELKGDKLTICWAEMGSDKRPKKFVTKVAAGSGAVLETYQSVVANKPSNDKPGTTTKHADGKVDAKAEAKSLEGNWKLIRSEFRGRLRPSGFRKEGLFFEDGKISWTEDQRANGQQGDFTVDGSANPKTIDVVITRGNPGQKLLGIYKISGDRLTICWGEPGSEKRPKKFVTRTAVGAGVTMETYQKQKD